MQISGCLKRYSKEHVSHETIYNYIWKNNQQGGLLYKELRHEGKKYNKHRKGTSGRGCIPNRIDIDQRPSKGGTRNKLSIENMSNCKRHDFRLFKESKTQIHPAISVLTDTGYQGLQKIHAKTQMPKKKKQKEPTYKER
jgi:hypothetical protein